MLLGWTKNDIVLFFFGECCEITFDYTLNKNINTFLLIVLEVLLTN